MTATTVQRGPLTRGRLAPGRALAFAAAGVAAAALLFWVTPLQGRADFLLAGYLFAAGAYLGAAGLVEGRRRVADRLARLLVTTAVAVCLVSLGAVLAYTAVRGLRALDLRFLTHSMHGVGPAERSGGAYHAMVGTVEQVLLASAFAIPVGIVVAVYLSEVGHGRTAGGVRAVVDLMLGIPSIVAGLFVYAFWVLGLHRGFSGLAAALALAVIMLPIVVRSSEEMIRLVPASLREAAYALGVARWRTVVGVVLPTALGGITTGVVLAVARISGETAPLLLTAFGADSINNSPFRGPQSALPLFVFTQASSPYASAVDRAWAGAFCLVLVVVVLTAVARLLTRGSRAVAPR